MVGSKRQLGRFTNLVAAVAIVAIGAGCGGGGGGLSSLSGTWTGSLSSNLLFPPATITMVLTQTGTALAGTFSSFGTKNIGGGAVSGTVSASLVSFTLTASGSCVGAFAASGSVSGSTLTFTFTGGNCNGQHAGGQGALSLQGGGGGGDGGPNPNLFDGGANFDGGSTFDGGAVFDGGTTNDGGLAGSPCTVNSDCFLAHRCNTNINQCETAPGGTGTDCPSGNECAQNGLNYCSSQMGPLPNSSPVCIQECSSGSDCPKPWTCQGVPVQGADGGVATLQICLPEDALGTRCRNFVGGINGSIDGVKECTVNGQICLPESETSDYGFCQAGDGCSFPNQTGCPANETCHPAGAFGLDNSDATICFTAGQGTQGIGCASAQDCSVGFTCIPVQGGTPANQCLKYCQIGGAACPTGTCRDLAAQLPVAVRPSYSIGVCL